MAVRERLRMMDMREMIQKDMMGKNIKGNARNITDELERKNTKGYERDMRESLQKDIRERLRMYMRERIQKDVREREITKGYVRKITYD